MAPQSSVLQWLCSLLLFAGAASALKFDLYAHSGGESSRRERCIRNFVNSNTLVVVTSTVDGYKGDGMVVNIHVCGPPSAPPMGCRFDGTVLLGGSVLLGSWGTTRTEGKFGRSEML
jgi:hypothetical protein